MLKCEPTGQHRIDERSRYTCKDGIGLQRTLGLALGVLEGTLCLSLQVAGSSLNLQGYNVGVPQRCIGMLLAVLHDFTGQV